MHAAITPYELCAGSLASALGLMLAEGVITVLPGGSEAPRGVMRARRAASALSWTAPLLAHGLIGEAIEAFSARESVVRAARRFDRERGGLVGALAKGSLLNGAEDRERSSDKASWEIDVDALLADVLCGGANPAVSVPMAAGLAELAESAGVVLIRSGSDSIVGMIERAFGVEVGRLMLPVFMPADGESLLAARESLSTEVEALGGLLAEASWCAHEGGDDASVRAALGGCSSVATRLRESAVAHRHAIAERSEAECSLVVVRVEVRVTSSDSVWRAAEAASAHARGKRRRASATEGAMARRGRLLELVVTPTKLDA